jgi:hypothetical protein
MPLHTFDLWEIALGGTQISLCGLILLFLVRNRSKSKQLSRKAANDGNARHFNAEFIVETLRQQTETAFNHILDTINKERQALETYFELREIQNAACFFKSTARNDAVSVRGAVDLEATHALYDQIESLAEQGISPTDISERLNVPQGEVDLVLKLKRLSAESGKTKASSSSP